MCNEMRGKLVECYGRKQMLGRNYASRDNHLRWYCVCWGVNWGRGWGIAEAMYCWAPICPWNLDEELSLSRTRMLDLCSGAYPHLCLFLFGFLRCLDPKHFTCWCLERQQHGVAQEAGGQQSTFILAFSWICSKHDNPKTKSEQWKAAKQRVTSSWETFCKQSHPTWRHLRVYGWCQGKLDPMFWFLGCWGKRVRHSLCPPFCSSC